MTATGPMTKAVTDALKASTVPDGDRAAVALALGYAHLLDASRGTEQEVDTFSDLGPKLLAALTALGMTAAGRGAKGGGQGGAAVASKLDELRRRREQRARVDAS